MAELSIKLQLAGRAVASREQLDNTEPHLANIVY
jgi:hypothetical protein